MYELLELIAINTFNLNAYYLNHLDAKELFNDYQIDSLNIYYFFPLIIEKNNHFTLLNRSLVFFLLVNKANKLKNIEDYISFIENIIIGDEEESTLILQLLEESNSEKISFFMNTELERFTKSVCNSNDKEKVLSILKFFNYTFNLDWNKKNKKFEESSCSQSESILESIFKYKGIKFNIMDLNIYFLADYHTPENCKKYFIDKKYYKDLYQTIINYEKPKNRHDILYDSKQDFFDIDLFKLASNDDIYIILKNIGLEKYILSKLNEIEKITI